MKHVVTRGIVLARTDFGEADRILTILTPDHGKIRVMAKGVRKVKSKLAGGIELLSVSNITFIPGRKDISTLVSSRLEKHFGHIVEDLDRTMLAYELLKRTNKATEDELGVEYFELLEQALADLNEGTNLQLIEAWFDARLLLLAGLQPNLITSNKGQRLDPAGTFTFDHEHMCFAEASAGSYHAADIKLMRLLFESAELGRLTKLKSIEVPLAACSRLLRVLHKQHSGANS